MDFHLISVLSFNELYNKMLTKLNKLFGNK